MTNHTEWLGIRPCGSVIHQHRKWYVRFLNKDFNYYKSFDTEEEAYTDRDRFCKENNLYKNYYRIINPGANDEYRELKIFHKNKEFLVKYDSNIQELIENNTWNLRNLNSTGIEYMSVVSYTLEGTLTTILYPDLVRRPLTDVLDYRSSAFKQKDEYEPVPEHEKLTYFSEENKLVSHWFTADKNKPRIAPLGNQKYRVSPHLKKFQELVQDFENFNDALEYAKNFLIKDNGFVHNAFRFVKDSVDGYHVEVKLGDNTKYHILLCEVDHLHIVQKYSLYSKIHGKTYYCSAQLGKSYDFHRLAYPKYKMIDHINTKTGVLDELGISMNGLDNRRSNIREVTARQNCNNKRVIRPSNTGHTGVRLSQIEGRKSALVATWPVKHRECSKKTASFTISEHGGYQNALDKALAARVANYTLYLYEIGEL